MKVSQRAIVIGAAVLLSAIGIYVSSSSPWSVGDTGPGGGTIVYVDKAGFNNSVEDDTSIGAMCLTETCHYLEMAPTDIEGPYSWEEAIVAAEAFFTPSANDWILPSKGALNEMCKYAFGDSINVKCNDGDLHNFSLRFGSYSPVIYWSSSEHVNFTAAWAQDFANGYQNGSYKDTKYYVRPVRAF